MSGFRQTAAAVGGKGGALYDDAVSSEDYIGAIASEINIRMWLWWNLTDRRDPSSSEKTHLNATSCTKIPHALARDRTWSFAVRGFRISTLFFCLFTRRPTSKVAVRGFMPKLRSVSQLETILAGPSGRAVYGVGV